MKIIDLIKKLPLDLAQGKMRHKTKGKLIAFSFVEPGHKRRALDLGCGNGYWSNQLKKKGWNVTSADIEKNATNALIVDAEKPLPFLNNYFDLIWSSEVIEHIKNLDNFIYETKRVLKPRGSLIITTPNSSFWLYKVLNPLGLTPEKLQNPDHKQFFCLNDIKRLLPTAQIYGFFPYAILKFRIKKAIGLLSPTFVIIEKR